MRTKLTHREDTRKNALTIPLTEAQKEEIRIAAQNAGLTMATFVRNLVLTTIRKGDN